MSPSLSSHVAPNAADSPATSTSKAKLQSAKLHPKEHGAYAILAIPIVTALLIVGPTLVGLLIATSAFTGFLAHEPLLVVWGHRGRRAQGNSPAAGSRLAVLLTITMFTGCLAIVTGGVSVRWALVACMALASTSFALALAGQHRTLSGQLWGVAGLSLPCVPILLAGGLTWTDALSVWTIWLIGFCATTLAVRSVIAAQKRQSRAIQTLTLLALSLIAVSFLASNVWLTASLPMLVLSWFLVAAPPATKHLRRVGWTLVGGTLLSALILLFQIRT